MDITVELSRDLVLVTRTNYSVLSLLANIGGIQSFMFGVISMLLGMFNHNHVDFYMASRLFRQRPRDSGSSSSSANDSIEVPRFSNIRWMCCGDRSVKRLTRNERALVKAREIMLKETNIIEIVKSRRFFDLALRTLLRARMRQDLKKQCDFI